MVERVKIEGLRELKTALRELPDSTAKNVIRRVLKKAGKPIADAAQARVPVDFGDLKKSIGVSTKLSRRQKGTHRKGGPNDVEVFVGTGSHPSAHMQEFGTRKHPAQPFMRPAWDATKKAALAGIKADLWQEIKKAAERLAKKMAKAKLAVKG
jgi:HK97 gp10 family phage protein